jgi:hypothetical protein
MEEAKLASTRPTMNLVAAAPNHLAPMLEVVAVAPRHRRCRAMAVTLTGGGRILVASGKAAGETAESPSGPPWPTRSLSCDRREQGRGGEARKKGDPGELL